MVETLVIGLDAATWRVMDPLLRDGKLPNFEKLIDEGVKGELQSTLPPMTPLAWTSIATGVNPGKHGIFDFLEQDKDTYQIKPVNYSKMDSPAIWDILEREKVGIINFPLAHPPREVDDFFISGPPVRSKKSIAYPEEVQEYINSTDYRVHPDTKPEDTEEYFDEVKEVTDEQCKATLELMDRYDLGLLWTVFMGVDWVQHYLWDKKIDDENAVEEFYMYMDDVVGRLMDGTEEDSNTVVLSDHGARKIKGELHMNNLLEEWGYLRRKDEDEGVLEKLKNKTVSSLWNVGVRLPQPVKDQIKKRTSLGVIDEIRKMAGAGPLGMDKSIDWEETEAFSYGYMGRVFVNTRGKYAEGKIDETEYEEFRNEITDRLKNLEHPETGEKIFDKVVKREEIYTGQHSENGPDLLAIPEEWEYRIYGDFADDWIMGPKKRIADHDERGMVILHGSGLQEDVEKDLDVVDIAPMLLYLHGYPIPKDMDGGIPETVFTEQFRENNDVEYIDGFSVTQEAREDTSQDQQEVLDRLEDLGYR